MSASCLYLDYQATTPCDPRVVECMLPYMMEHFGNPHSRNHVYGWKAEEAVQNARHEIAKVIGAEDKDIIFTSGATEANNLALKGLARFEEKGHIITLTTEHKCVLESLRALEEEGFKVTYLPVESSGLVSLDALEAAMTPETILVSICAVNGEIGVIQPMEKIGALCRRKGVRFHTDAAQAYGKIALNVDAMGIDLMSVSSHKIYGPKGVGALYVRRRPRVRLKPLFHGGGQERGLRSGTLPGFLCVGFGEAARVAELERESETTRLKNLRDRFLATLFANLEEISLNGDLNLRIPGNLNISFFGVEGESLMMGIKNMAVSSGSACTSSSLEPSYVLKAIGLPEELAHSSLRISFGRMTTQEDVDYASHHIIQAVNRLRDMSPLWDMHKAGIDLSQVQWSAH